MSAIPLHHSSQHAARLGADPESDLSEGQPTDWSGAQVSGTNTHTHSVWDTNREKSSKYLCLFRLCSLEGAAVSSAGELETGHCYVATGTERFKKLPYVELLVSKAAERYCYAGVLMCVRAATRSNNDNVLYVVDITLERGGC